MKWRTANYNDTLKMRSTIQSAYIARLLIYLFSGYCAPHTHTHMELCLRVFRTSAPQPTYASVIEKYCSSIKGIIHIQRKNVLVPTKYCGRLKHAYSSQIRSLPNKSAKWCCRIKAIFLICFLLEHCPKYKQTDIDILFSAAIKLNVYSLNKIACAR